MPLGHLRLMNRLHLKTLATIISDKDSTEAFPVNDDDDSLWDVVVISF